MNGTGAGFDPRTRAAALVSEFRAFAFKGNVVDLAVAVVVGAAFGKIIDSLVKNILMPAVAVVTPGDQGYTGWTWTVNGKEIPYGLFLGDVVPGRGGSRPARADEGAGIARGDSGLAEGRAGRVGRA